MKDLTSGKPEIVLWKFSIPMFVSVIFQQLYNIADSVIAGKFAGEDALAAVGASYPITMIFMAIAIGSNIGSSVVISTLFGAKQYHKMKTAISTTLLSAAVLSVLLTIGGLFGTSGLMKMIRTPENIFSDGALYLRIYIGGFLFLFLYNVCTGVFTSLGDSKTPLYFLIGSSIGNIVLDYIFVADFKWGVAGVAWATFLAQGVACVLALITLLKRIQKIQTKEKREWFSGKMLIKIGKIAVPSIAGYSAAIKLNTFAITSFTTLSNGLSSFTAQNLGAEKPERVKKGFRAGVQMAFLVAIPFVVLFVLFPDTMLSLFLKEESQQAKEAGQEFIKIISPFYFVISVKLMADGVLRGAGAMKQFMIATFLDLALRVILAFILATPYGTRGIWLSWPIGWAIAAIISYVFYKKGCWDLKKK